MTWMLAGLRTDENTAAISEPVDGVELDAAN
jgi:hypothetical protein